MAGFLLDTNVVSEPGRLSPDPKVLAWLESHPNILFYLSVISLGEMHKGIELLVPSARRDRLAAFVAEAIPRRLER